MNNKKMIIYTGGNGDPDRINTMRNSDRLGMMWTPENYKRNIKVRYALDNGAYGAWVNGVSWNSCAFLKILKIMIDPDFVVLPDIVAGGKKSLEHSLAWSEILPDTVTWYLAVQDGMVPSKLPDVLLKRIGGIFVGGSMPWKESTSQKWIEFAHSKKLLCHIGRVGTLVGILWAERLGADSIDSVNFARHRKNWNELVEYLNGEHKSIERFIVEST